MTILHEILLHRNITFLNSLNDGQIKKQANDQFYGLALLGLVLLYNNVQIGIFPRGIVGALYTYGKYVLLRELSKVITIDSNHTSAILDTWGEV